MASKFGPRAVGTDGSDFGHRQRVAPHFRESVTNKFRLKCAAVLHASLLVIILVKLLEDILDRFEIDWDPLERLKVPVPHFWEYWWMLSALPCIASLTALPRNNERRLRWCYYGFFLFGLLPVAIGAGYKLPQLLDYLGYGDTNGSPQAAERFLGFPMVVIWFMFFAVALQVHAFTMSFASNLVKAWRPATTKHSQQQTTTASSTSVSTEKLSGNGAMWQNDKKIK
jgi:hypothetical protein